MEALQVHQSRQVGDTVRRAECVRSRMVAVGHRFVSLFVFGGRIRSVFLFVGGCCFAVLCSVSSLFGVTMLVHVSLSIRLCLGSTLHAQHLIKF